MATGFAAHILGPDDHSSLPDAATVPYGAIYYCTDHDLMYRNNDGTWGTYFDNGAAGGGVTGSQAALANDVAMSSADTFYDGPSLSLDGSYLVIAFCTIRSTAAADFTAKLWNGTTVGASGASTIRNNTDTEQICLAAIVTTSGSETWKISVAANGNTGTLKAEPPNNATGTTDTATKIVALKIA